MNILEGGELYLKTLSLIFLKVVKISYLLVVGCRNCSYHFERSGYIVIRFQVISKYVCSIKTVTWIIVSNRVCFRGCLLQLLTILTVVLEFDTGVALN